MSVEIYGFSILKNGVKFDYSFRESLNSLVPICKKVFVAAGDSEDATTKELKKLSGVEVFETTWDPNLRQGGLILSEQTNLSLNHLREQAPEKNAWGIYLQADEVLHENDYERIKNDIAKAEEQGCDVLRFRYFHFWQSHSKVAINKKWYPQEIRAVKLRSDVESWGDAQSFRGVKKVYESDAFIYHYGHVREEESYKNKKEGFFRMYASDEKFKAYVTKMEKKDAKTETLDFWGSHPRVMKERIERLGESFALPVVSEIAIVGDENCYSEGFKKRIRAKKVIWGEKKSELSSMEKVVLTQPSFFQRLCGRAAIPSKMRSDLARDWEPETRLMFQLSQQGIGVD